MHAEGFFALVLKGSYVEAGDTGRHRVSPGDVIVHRPFEQHLDRFSSGGAEVLILPLPDRWSTTVLARVADPDSIAVLAERDIVAAREAALETMVERPMAIEDWPDLLARDLLGKPDLSLSSWADRHGLHPGSLARGFGQQFSISPNGFRTVVRARRAIEEIVATNIGLSSIALDHGFADQAHMSRIVRRLTGLPPRALRKALAQRDAVTPTEQRLQRRSG
jgi:AraC-like DNA-binding protein